MVHIYVPLFYAVRPSWATLGLKPHEQQWGLDCPFNRVEMKESGLGHECTPSQQDDPTQPEWRLAGDRKDRLSRHFASHKEYLRGIVPKETADEVFEAMREAIRFTNLLVQGRRYSLWDETYPEDSTEIFATSYSPFYPNEWFADDTSDLPLHSLKPIYIPLFYKVESKDGIPVMYCPFSVLQLAPSHALVKRL
ncbi:hypothetical protein T439DRAFT_325901 [Meredithblackwellia eburnea MCA 4105]